MARRVHPAFNGLLQGVLATRQVFPDRAFIARSGDALAQSDAEIVAERILLRHQNGLGTGGRFQIGDIVVHKEVPQDAKDDIDLWSG